ncbi:hypothetical protein V8E53_007650 [Lactarius tabidus]
MLTRMRLLLLSPVPLSTPYKAIFSITAMVPAFSFPHPTFSRPGRSTTRWYRVRLSPCQLTVLHSTEHCVRLDSIPYLLYTRLNFWATTKVILFFLNQRQISEYDQGVLFLPLLSALLGCFPTFPYLWRHIPVLKPLLGELYT